MPGRDGAATVCWTSSRARMWPLSRTHGIRAIDPYRPFQEIRFRPLAPPQMELLEPAPAAATEITVPASVI